MDTDLRVHEVYYEYYEWRIRDIPISSHFSVDIEYTVVALVTSSYQQGGHLGVASMIFQLWGTAVDLSEAQLSSWSRGIKKCFSQTTLLYSYICCWDVKWCETSTQKIFLCLLKAQLTTCGHRREEIHSIQSLVAKPSFFKVNTNITPLNDRKHWIRRHVSRMLVSPWIWLTCMALSVAATRCGHWTKKERLLRTQGQMLWSTSPMWSEAEKKNDFSTFNDRSCGSNSQKSWWPPQAAQCFVDSFFYQWPVFEPWPHSGGAKAQWELWRKERWKVGFATWPYNEKVGTEWYISFRWPWAKTQSTILWDGYP